MFSKNEAAQAQNLFNKIKRKCLNYEFYQLTIVNGCTMTVIFINQFLLRNRIGLKCHLTNTRGYVVA